MLNMLKGWRRWGRLLIIICTSILGQITVANTFILYKLINIGTVLPTPPQKYCDVLAQVIYKYIHGKNNKVHKNLESIEKIYYTVHMPLEISGQPWKCLGFVNYRKNLLGNNSMKKAHGSKLIYIINDDIELKKKTIEALFKKRFSYLKKILNYYFSGVKHLVQPHYWLGFGFILGFIFYLWSFIFFLLSFIFYLYSYIFHLLSLICYLLSFIFDLSSLIFYLLCLWFTLAGLRLRIQLLSWLWLNTYHAFSFALLWLWLGLHNISKQNSWDNHKQSIELS